MELGNTFYFGWEVALMAALQQHMGFLGQLLANIFTAFGEQVVIFAIMGYIYWCRDKELGKIIGVNMATALVWNPMIKNIFLRRRPYMDHGAIQCLNPVNPGDIYSVSLQGYSFPSGHATNAAALYGTIAMGIRRKPWTAGLLTLIFLVGVSRFCLGVHYPTDVLAGWALGGAVAFFMTWLQQKVKVKWKLFALLLAVSLPGCFYCKSTDYFSTLGVLIGILTGVLFEERFVRFENARTTPERLLRFFGGVIFFSAMHVLFKMPFSSEFLGSTTPGAMTFRVVRHAVEIFLISGIYPMLFSWRPRVHGRHSE